MREEKPSIAAPLPINPAAASSGEKHSAFLLLLLLFVSNYQHTNRNGNQKKSFLGRIDFAEFQTQSFNSRETFIRVWLPPPSVQKNFTLHTSVPVGGGCPKLGLLMFFFGYGLVFG